MSPDGSAVANATNNAATPVSRRPLARSTMPPPACCNPSPPCSAALPPVPTAAVGVEGNTVTSGSPSPCPSVFNSFRVPCGPFFAPLAFFFLPKLFVVDFFLTASGVSHRHAHRARISRKGNACLAARSPPGVSLVPRCTWAICLCVFFVSPLYTCIDISGDKLLGFSVG